MNWLTKSDFNFSVDNKVEIRDPEQILSEDFKEVEKIG